MTNTLSSQLIPVTNFIIVIFCLSFQTETYGAVYKKLTGKDVTFEFPEFTVWAGWPGLTLYKATREWSEHCRIWNKIRAGNSPNKHLFFLVFVLYLSVSMRGIERGFITQRYWSILGKDADIHILKIKIHVGVYHTHTKKCIAFVKKTLPIFVLIVEPS